MSELLARLRGIDVTARAGKSETAAGRLLQDEFVRSGVKFAASPAGGALEHAYYAALGKLADCVRPDPNGRPVLQEGGVYDGCWLESTGTINAELLARFAPAAAQATFEQFAAGQRDDGLIPYKVTRSGPVFKQIQLVTPPARSMWNHYRMNGKDRGFLERMYASLSRYDEWLATRRNTRGTGCVEAFCTFDTGHDLSPRFWHIPDTPEADDPERYDPDSPLLPLLAPDLTAAVYCGRLYLARMAGELGDEAAARTWTAKAEETLTSLFDHCYDEEDGFFYDVDRHGRRNRMQTDVLLRVLACEVGDAAFFASSLSRYLLHTRKFFAKYPFTSVAMDDPRFDPHAAYNTWGGAVNFLSLIRAPHPFEQHGRLVEMSWVMQPILSALSRMTRFGQVLSPWTGEEGYTESYSPAILCMLDYTERLCGIMPSPSGELLLNGLLPKALDHGVKLADETAYSRTVGGDVYELHNTAGGCTAYRNGELLCRFPYGVRVAVDPRDGRITSVTGLTIRTVEGILSAGGADITLRIAGNETQRLVNGSFETVSARGVVLPAYE